MREALLPTRFCSSGIRRSAEPTTSVRAACGDLEDHPVLGADPTIRALPSSTRISILRRTISRMPGIAMRRARETAHGRGAAPSNARPLAATPSGSTWAAPMRTCPTTSRQRLTAFMRDIRSRRASARTPIEKRHSLKAQYPDAEHPVVTHPDTGERCCSSHSYATHFYEFHVAKCSLRPGLFTRRITTSTIDLRAAIPNIGSAGAGDRIASLSGIIARRSITLSWITGRPSGKWSDAGIRGTSRFERARLPEREAVRLLADRVSNASSTEDLLALLEQMVTNCSEIIATILADRPPSDLNLSNNEII